MSSCFSVGGRAYRLDSGITSSSSSTLSDSSNSPIAISTRKPRTPRKRPNQAYNEAAALLSTLYPKIFSAKPLTKPFKFSKSQHTFLDEPPELLLPFPAMDTSGFLLHQPILEKPNFGVGRKVFNTSEKPCQSPVKSDFYGNSLEFCDGYQEDFDTESMLDEEMEEGIDSIMGNLSVRSDLIDESNTCIGLINTSYGYPMGLGFSGNFEFGFGMRRGVRALRNVEESNWWSSTTVNVVDISPNFKKILVQKRKKKVEKAVATENSIPERKSGPRLKLNYDKVLDAWSDRGRPFPEEISGWETSGNDDIHVGFSTPARNSKSKEV